MPRPKIPCAICGTPKGVGSGSKPAGQLVCLPCRRATPEAVPGRRETHGTCVDCGKPKTCNTHPRCLPCAGLTRRKPKTNPG